MQEVSNITATIAAGQSLSAEVDIGNQSLVGIILPANWTAAGLSLQVSPDGGTTWAELWTVAGAPYAVGTVTIPSSTPVYIAIDPTTLRGALSLKIRSGTQASPVNQTNLVSLTLITRLVW